MNADPVEGLTWDWSGGEAPTRPDAGRVAARVAEAYASGPPVGSEAVVATLGVSPTQLATTPISLRVGVAAAAAGCRFAHHELRTVPPRGEALTPDVAVWERDDLAPVWVDGVREAPKYFSFFLEEPQAPFHPNHRVQWRAHELLHRLVGFAWRPDLTPFEAYVSARLSELLPVVHWYGFDEMGRRRCPRHQGVQLFDQYCGDCEAAVATPYGHGAIAAPVATLEATARAAFEHLDTELAACRREIESGRIHATPRPRLDASSDAVGYLRAHWPRLTAWSFGAWIERFSIPGVDHHTGPSRLADHLVDVATRLLGGPLVFEPRRAADLAARRVAQDVGYRVLLTLEARDDAALEDRILPALDQLGAAVVDGADDLERTIAAGLDELDARIGDDVALRDAVAGLGYDALGRHASTHARSRACLAEGLDSGLPDWAGRTLDDGREAVIDGLSRAPELWQAGELRVRASPWLDELGRLEAWLRRRPHRDEEAELFGVVYEDGDGDGHGDAGHETLRLNTTLLRTEAAGSAVAELFGWPVAGQRRVPLVRIWLHGRPRAYEETPQLAAVLGALREDQPVEDRAVLREAVALGLVVYLPPVRG